MLAFSPLSAQLGHEEAEKNTQHLMVTYSAAAAEMAMYEALAAVATASGDGEMVPRALQSEEKEDHVAGMGTTPAERTGVLPRGSQPRLSGVVRVSAATAAFRLVAAPVRFFDCFSSLTGLKAALRVVREITMRSHLQLIQYES